MNVFYLTNFRPTLKEKGFRDTGSPMSQWAVFPTCFAMWPIQTDDKHSREKKIKIDIRSTLKLGNKWYQCHLIIQLSE